MPTDRNAPAGGRRPPRRHLARSASCCWLSALLATTALAETPTPGLLEIASAFGFDAAQVRALRADETVGGQLEANSDNELALSMAMLSERDLVWHSERMELALTSDPTVHSTGVLVGDGRASLEELKLPAEELDGLANLEPGKDANFSAKEYEELARAAARSDDPEVRRDAMQGAMREILVRRLADYKAKGLSGIEPYARGKGRESSPGPQLERAFTALRVTSQLVPDVYRAMADFPASLRDGVSSRFSWIMHEARGRMVVALSHIVFGREGDHLAAIERRFYVSHTLNALQVVAIALPIEEGTAIFYANRTGTDQVTGFGSSVAKGVGRNIMRAELVRLIEAFETVDEPGG